MIIQIVGLPCTGKSFYINKFNSVKNTNVKFLDIINFSNFSNREKALKKEALKLSSEGFHVIVESACGLNSLSSIVILCRASKKLYARNMNRRKESFSFSYLEHIENQIIPANYTVYSYKSFEALLTNLIQGKNNNERASSFKNTNRQSL